MIGELVNKDSSMKPVMMLNTSSIRSSDSKNSFSNSFLENSERYLLYRFSSSPYRSSLQYSLSSSRFITLKASAPCSCPKMFLFCTIMI